MALAGVVGVEHQLLSEGIVAFVEKKPGAELDAPELKRHARGMASYMRPLHYVLLEPGEMPLNRVAKIDYVRLAEMARAEVEALRGKRKWKCDTRWGSPSGCGGHSARLRRAA